MPLRTQAAVDLVGADVVEEPEAAAGGPCRFEEIERPDDIGLNEAVRPFDGTVHMGLGGKMADGVDPVSVEDVLERGHIADVRLSEEIPPRIRLRDAAQIIGIPRIGQAVRIDDPPPEILLSQADGG